MKSVLVTGGNRTGTSWVGKMLCFDEDLFFVWEPFNSESHTPFTKHPLHRHYRKLLPDEFRSMKRYIRRRTLFELMNSVEGGKGFSRKIKKFTGICTEAAGYLAGSKTPLFKDPIALMSAEWFEQEYQSRIVMTVRHPGAYVNSIKRLDWPMCVEEFANQPQLDGTLPEDLQEEIRKRILSRVRPKGYVLEDAALCWKVFYQIVHQYRTDHKNWLVVRHEDLSADYIEGFKELYNKLGLSWTAEVSRNIDEYCSPRNNIVLGDRNYKNKQDSASIAQLWKSSLDSTEKKSIRGITESVAELFYDHASWE